MCAAPGLTVLAGRCRVGCEVLLFAGAEWAWNLAFFSSLFEEHFARLWGLMLGLWGLSQLLLVALPGEAEGVLASLRCLSVPPSPYVSHCASVTVPLYVYHCVTHCCTCLTVCLPLCHSLRMCHPLPYVCLTGCHSDHRHQQRDQTHSGKPSE